jgi:hypothetical protein
MVFPEPEELTVRVTVKVPTFLYAWTGFWVVSDAPSPKSHRQDVGFPTVVSENTTVRGAVPDRGEPVKEARRPDADVDDVVAVVAVVVVAVAVVVEVVLGAASTEMYSLLVADELPVLVVAVSLTV